MDAGTKSKIAVFVCFICFFQVQCISSHDESLHTIQNYNSFLQDSVRSIIKRSADWSKRLSAFRSLEVPAHVAEGSEIVEVTSKPPRIVRRMRVHRKGEQGVEIFKEANPESRSKDGGKGNRIVRVKKFKRKLVRKPTTAAPEIFTPRPTVKPTDDPKVTSSSPYSHITVINKEIRTQKKNRKNKKKKRKYNLTASSIGNMESTSNGIKHAVEAPQTHELLGSQPMERSFNIRQSFPNFDSYFTRIQSSNPNNKQRDIYPGAERFGQQYAMPMINENYKNSGQLGAGIPPHFTRNSNRMDELGYLSNSMMNDKYTSPMFILSRYSREEARKPQSNQHTNLKESSTEIKEVKNVSQELNTENPANKTADNKTEATVDRAGDSPITPPTVFKNNTSPSPSIKESNETEARNPDPQPKIPLKKPQVVMIPIGGTVTSPQERFPPRYPSLLYGGQNAFSDPFFDTPEIPLPMHRSRMGGQLITPWGHRLSPFYASGGSESDESMFGGGIEPYQSDEMIPGFHPSPQLTSLRRSILDTYANEPTTPEPVTAFSLPKFEIPSIDFNDKGCQTVYKEVKTVPGDNPQARNSNAKSFVIARECYFPNGVPTTEQQDKSATDAPDILNMSESKDMEADSKE